MVLELPAPESGRAHQDRQGRRRHGGEQRGDRHHRHRGQGRRQAPLRRGTEAGRGGGRRKAPAQRPQPQPRRRRRACRSPVAMPAARKIAAEKGVDLTAHRRHRARRAHHQGRRGRAARRDRPADPRLLPPPVDIDQVLGDRPEQRVPMSRLRQRVAERLVQSQSTAAILTTFNEVNMQPVMDLRNKYKERFEKEHGVRLGFMSFFVKAVGARAEEVPGGERLGRRHRHRLPRLLRHRHRGGQPARPGGADHPQRRPAVAWPTSRSRSPTSASARRKASSRIEELTGGTFSISNGGVFGSMLSTPIINPPQSAILGIHATKDRPVVENGQIVIRPMNYLAMSYDHRIIDGREAVLSPGGDQGRAGRSGAAAARSVRLTAEDAKGATGKRDRRSDRRRDRAWCSCASVRHAFGHRPWHALFTPLPCSLLRLTGAHHGHSNSTSQ